MCCLGMLGSWPLSAFKTTVELTGNLVIRACSFYFYLIVWYLVVSVIIISAGHDRWFCLHYKKCTVLYLKNTLLLHVTWTWCRVHHVYEYDKVLFQNKLKPFSGIITQLTDFIIPWSVCLLFSYPKLYSSEKKTLYVRGCHLKTKTSLMYFWNSKYSHYHLYSK